jgi:hypothetical protein
MLRKNELRELAAKLSPRPRSGGLNPRQEPAIVLSTGLESIGAFLRTESGSPGVVPDKAKLSVANGATLGCAVGETLKSVAHSFLL